MEYKKKTIIWEDNNEPPKDYIWVRSNGKAYEFSYTTREWKEIMSSSGDCSGGQSSTTEFRTIARNGKPIQESDLKEGDTVQPLYDSTYSEPHKGDLVKAKMVNGELDAEFVDDPRDYVVETYERCGETYKTLIKKTIPLNCIYYTTISGDPIDTTGVTLTITSNTYQNGQGIITFENNLTGTFTQTFFSNNQDLLTIELPDGITGIGERVFDKCKKLEYVKLPKGLLTIGIKAFNECNSLQEIKLPESLNTLDEGAFRRCYALTEVIIPDNVTGLIVNNNYSGVFQDCTSLKTAILSSNTREIGQDAFDNCPALESIYIPKDVQFIYNSANGVDRPAFNSCSGLREIVVDPRNQTYYSGVNCEEYNGIFYEEVGGTYAGRKTLVRGCATTVLPDDVSIIGFGAFSGCQDFTGIELTDSVTTLSSWCFTITGLESINIPKNVTSLNAWCFANCPKLEEITVDSLNATYTSRNTNGDECNCIIGDMSDGHGGTKKALLVGCKTTTIPTDVDLTSIGPGAFNNQSEMTSITIPNNITYIDGDNVFNGCTALETVNYTGTMAEFAAINGGQGWKPWQEFLVPATVVHCSDGDIIKPNE